MLPVQLATSASECRASGLNDEMVRRGGEVLDSADNPADEIMTAETAPIKPPAQVHKIVLGRWPRAMVPLAYRGAVARFGSNTDACRSIPS